MKNLMTRVLRCNRISITDHFPPHTFSSSLTYPRPWWSFLSLFIMVPCPNSSTEGWRQRDDSSPCLHPPGLEMRKGTNVFRNTLYLLISKASTEYLPTMWVSTGCYVTLAWAPIFLQPSKDFWKLCSVEIRVGAWAGFVDVVSIW